MDEMTRLARACGVEDTTPKKRRPWNHDDIWLGLILVFPVGLALMLDAFTDWFA